MVLKILSEIGTIEIVSSSVHDVGRINSIDQTYKGERQESKAPTFALTRPSPY